MTGSPGRRLWRFVHRLLGGVPSTPSSCSVRLSSGAFARTLSLSLDFREIIDHPIPVPVPVPVSFRSFTREEASQWGWPPDCHPPTGATRKCHFHRRGRESRPRESMRHQSLELVSRGGSDVERGEAAWPEQASECATVSMLRASFLPSLFLLRLISRSAGPETPQSNPLTRSSQLARSAPIESSPHSPYRPTITASRLSPRSSPADLSRGY